MNTLWILRFKNMIDYMFLKTDKIFLQFVIRTGNWILIFANMIPISLMVSLETVKFIQAKIIANDQELETENGKIPCRVQSSNLNEELGQIKYIFSDKTGTLTCNEMNFKKFIVGNLVFGEPNTGIQISDFETEENHNLKNLTSIKTKSNYVLYIFK